MAIFMGVLTGIGGGILRDVLVNQTPTVLEADIYAVAALAAGVVVVIGYVLHYPAFVVLTVGALLCLWLRVMAIYRWRTLSLIAALLCVLLTACIKWPEAALKPTILDEAMVLSVIAGWTDLRSQRIPNWLTLPAFALSTPAPRLSSDQVGNVSLEQGVGWSWQGPARARREASALEIAVGIPLTWYPPRGPGRALISASGSYRGWLAAKRCAG